MWSSPPEPLDLSDETVDVWRLSLDLSQEAVECVAQYLTDEERARAARFRFRRDQNCYLSTRGTLRLLLAAYVNLPPKEITFRTGEHGKPALSPTHKSSPPIEFNVSHSGDWSLFAFSRRRAVGVDVEHMRPRKSLELVAEHHFSPSEFDAVIQGDEDGRLERFYRCWTRKEAYMKATGMGIALGLKSFAVSVGEPAQVLWTDRGDADRWRMNDISPGEGYVGAVCVEGETSVQVRGFEVAIGERVEP